MRKTLIIKGNSFYFGYTCPRDGYKVTDEVPYMAFMGKHLPEILARPNSGPTLVNVDIDNIPLGNDLEAIISKLHLEWNERLGYSTCIMKSKSGDGIKAFFMIDGYCHTDEDFRRKAVEFTKARFREVEFLLPGGSIHDTGNVVKSYVTYNMLARLQRWNFAAVINVTNIIPFVKTTYIAKRWKKYPARLPGMLTKNLTTDCDKSVLNFFFSYLSKSTSEVGLDAPINFISEVYHYDTVQVSRSIKKLNSLGLIAGVSHYPVNLPSIILHGKTRPYVGIGKRRANTYRLAGAALEYGLAVYEKMQDFLTGERSKYELPNCIEDGCWYEEGLRATCCFKDGWSFIYWFKTLPGHDENGRLERAYNQWNYHAERHGLEKIDELSFCQAV